MKDYKTRRSTTTRTTASTIDTSRSDEFSIEFTGSEQKSFQEFLDKYKLNGIIGKGGQAVVREAIDKQSNEPVALKIFKKKLISF